MTVRSVGPSPQYLVVGAMSVDGEFRTRALKAGIPEYCT